MAPSEVPVLYTDAFQLHWRAFLVDSAGNKSARFSGDFPAALQTSHIGVKELFALPAGLAVYGASLRG